MKRFAFQSKIQNPKSKIGMVLLLVLWAIAILALLAGGLTFALRQNVAMTQIETGRVIAHQLARAGVERAIAEVMEDHRLADSPDDLWYDNPDEMKQIKLAGGSFTVAHAGWEETAPIRYGAGDESAKLNINAATHEQLMKLPRMTSSIASAIIDWRDENEQPEPDGIERAYYAALPHPYVIRNGPFKTVRELLAVRGIDAKILFGEDANANGILDANENDGPAEEPDDNADGRLDPGWFPYLTVYSYQKNVNASGEKRLNLKTASAAAISRRLNLESWAADAIVKARDKNQIKRLVDLIDVRRDAGGNSPVRDPDIRSRSDSEKDQPVTREIFKSIVDDITLKGDDYLVGQISVNTAPSTVLKTLPGMDDELAAAIIRDREGNKRGYASIGDLLDLSGMTKEKFGQMEDYITVRSGVFRIVSRGTSGSGLATATIECVVDRNGAVPKILYWLESSP